MEKQSTERVCYRSKDCGLFCSGKTKEPASLSSKAAIARQAQLAAIPQDAPFEAAYEEVIEWEPEPDEVAAAKAESPSAETITSGEENEVAAAEEGEAAAVEAAAAEAGEAADSYRFVADPAFDRGLPGPATRLGGRPGYWIAADAAEAEAAAAVATAADAVAIAAALAAAAVEAEGHEDPVDAAEEPAAWSSLLPGYGADEEPDEPGSEPDPAAPLTKKEETSDEDPDPEREPPASRALDWLEAKKEEPSDEACQNEPL